MDPADLRAFAKRDWAVVADMKTGFWIDQKRGMTVADVLEFADRLRRHASAVKPGWPTAEDRAEDLAVHLRVSEALRAVGVQPR